jgi:integrase
MPKRTHDGLKKRCGCARSTWARCPHAWHFSFHHNDREHRHSLDVLTEIRGERRPTSKSEAIGWRDRLRAEIRAGTPVDLAPSAATTFAAVNTKLTFGDVCDHYLKRHVRVPTRRPRGRREMEILIRMLRRAEIPAANNTIARLEAKPIDAVTRADIEAVRAWRRREQADGRSRPGTKGGEVGTNRLLSRLRHVFSWAIVEGYVSETPFKRGAVTVVKLETSVEAARTRRLEPGDEMALLTHADSHLRAVLVGALTTGCRIGELLSLQWSQIQRDDKNQARWILLPATKTKTAEARVLPIGPRLRAELEMRRHGPDGKEHPSNAYVFGNETGERVTSIRRCWEDTVLRAHGHAPVRTRGKLDAASRAAYLAIDLHVQDLRRQFACTLLESGAALHDVQAFLGHANITTTSRYLQSAPLRLEQALARMEQLGGFAQDSHTETDEAATEPLGSTPENPVSH